MEFRILGPVGVSDVGGDIPLGGRRRRVLLACLLMHAGTTVSADRLVEALWGDREPTSARQMLHVQISELRKLLTTAGASAGIHTRPTGYELRLGDDLLDALRFEEFAADGRRRRSAGDAAGAAEQLRAALGLWSGPPLADLAERPFAQAEIARWESLRVEVHEDCLDAELAAGRHREVVAELHRLVVDHPLRERLRHQLMLALYRDGRQSEALDVYRDAETHLREELGLDPSAELRELRDAVLRQDVALAVDERPVPDHNLPAPLTSFVGREAELAELDALLGASRLVTLTGVGGVGKSRLALEVAAAALPTRDDGVRVVELAAVRDPGLVESAVARALAVAEHPQNPLRDQILDRLRRADMLLVVDNCEHLVDAVGGLVRDMLRACPQLRVLCTSRERLAVSGEVVRPVAGLRVPGPGDDDAGSDAVRLFRDRAAAVRVDDRPNRTEADVVQICRRLDGLPLAIELAAARTTVLSPTQIADRLDDRFRLLTGGSRDGVARHQTLRAVVDWSYDLLDAAEQRFFECLTVFVGGFTLDAAEYVTGGDWEFAADLLARLVDKSLVLADSIDQPEYRYRLLETLREYGLHRLAERDDEGAVRQRHAAFFLDLARRAAVGLRTGEQPDWLRQIDVEHSNMRAALTYTIESGDDVTTAEIAGSLYQFWDLHGHYAEGRRWLDLARERADGVPAAARTRVLIGIATLAVLQGDLEHGIAACDEASAISRAGDDAAGLAHALQYRGLVAVFMAELDEARALLDASLATARAGNARWEHGWALLFLAMLALGEAEYDRADELARQSELVLRPTGDKEARSWLLGIVGAAAHRRGDRPLAAAALAAGTRSFHDLGGVWGTSVTLTLAALVIAERPDRVGPATRVAAAAETVREAAGAEAFWFVEHWVQAALGGMRAVLGPDRFDDEWRAGSALSLADAVTTAIAELRA